jgi:hypothetical protein
MADESSDSGSVCNNQYDPADVADVNVFEFLHGDPTMANPNRLTVDDALGTHKDATQQTDQAEPDDQPDTVDQEMALGVIVDRFPFGSLGDPIPGKVQGLSAFETLREMHAGTPWAPFSSQLEWEVARWAKMRSRTSTAVTELLAIPRVCFYLFSEYHTSNPRDKGCRCTWIIISHRQGTQREDRRRITCAPTFSVQGSLLWWRALGILLQGHN